MVYLPYKFFVPAANVCVTNEKYCSCYGRKITEEIAPYFELAMMETK